MSMRPPSQKCEYDSMLSKPSSYLNCAASDGVDAEFIIQSILNAEKHNCLQAKIDHELRSRCNEILDLASQLRNHDTVRRKGHETYAARLRIEKTTIGLLTVLDDINDFLTLQRGLPEPMDVDVNLRDAVLCEWEALDRRCDTSPAKIEIFTNDPGATVQGNPGCIRKAIGAVLMNAIRFNERTPMVTVRLAPFSDEFYRITVEDNGIGIPSELRNDVVTPFFQADNGFTCKYGGLGIGLAIANSVATLHMGKLKVTDGPAGVGTAVELFFPF